MGKKPEKPELERSLSLIVYSGEGTVVSIISRGRNPAEARQNITPLLGVLQSMSGDLGTILSKELASTGIPEQMISNGIRSNLGILRQASIENVGIDLSFIGPDQSNYFLRRSFNIGDLGSPTGESTSSLD